LLLDVAGKEVKVIPKFDMKSFDANGKQLTELGGNYRVLR
jgi:hypothetical protein